MRAQNDDIIKQMRVQNDLMNRERLNREKHLREIDHSRDKHGANSPENVNLLPYVDDSRDKMRREYEKNLRKENKDLDEEKRQRYTYQIKQKQEERNKMKEFHKAANDLEKSIKI